MPTTMILPLYVLLPIAFIGGVSGLKRGYKDELWTLGGLLVALAIVSRPDTLLLPVTERVISVFIRAGQELVGRDTSGPSFTFSEGVRPWVVIIAALILAALAYSLGRLLGKGEVGKGPMKLLGFLFGGLNLMGIAIWLASRFLDKSPDGRAGLTIPSFEGRQIVFSSPTANNVMASWPGLIGLLIVLILILFLLNRARVLR